MVGFKDKLKNFWSKIIGSKLNISVFIATVLVIILSIIFTFVVTAKLKEGITITETVKNTETASKEPDTESDIETTTASDSEEETTEEPYSTHIDENETSNLVNALSQVRIRLKANKSWSNDGIYFTQYSLTVTNISGSDIDGWALVMDLSGMYELVDSWSFTFKEGDRKLIINPVNENKRIKAGDEVTGGFIIKTATRTYINYFTFYNGNIVQTIRNNNNYIPKPSVPHTTTEESSSETEADTTTEPTEANTTTESPSTTTVTPHTTTPEVTDRTTEPTDEETTTPLPGENETTESETEGVNPAEMDETTSVNTENNIE